MSPKMYEGQLDGHRTIIVLKCGLQHPWNAVPKEKCSGAYLTEYVEENGLQPYWTVKSNIYYVFPSLVLDRANFSLLLHSS